MRHETRKKVLTFYTDSKGEHRWRLRAGNGKPIAGPQEGYKRAGAAEAGALSSLAGPSSSIERLPDSNHGELVGRPDIRVEWED